MHMSQVLPPLFLLNYCYPILLFFARAVVELFCAVINLKGYWGWF